jgi:hypothetical protein
LEWLGLGGNSIGPDGAVALAEGLSHNTHLTWLALGGNDIGDRGITRIAQWMSCMLALCGGHDVRMSICIMFLAAEECSLRSIGLGGNGITAAGGLALAKALRVNKSLESLGLAGNVLGMWCNHCILSFVLSNLDFRICRIRRVRVSVRGAPCQHHTAQADSVQQWH